MRKHQGVETFRSCRITDSVPAMGTGCAQVIASVDNPDPGSLHCIRLTRLTKCGNRRASQVPAFNQIVCNRASTSGRVARFSENALAEPVQRPIRKACSKSPVSIMPVRKPATMESPAPTELTSVPLGAGLRRTSPFSEMKTAPSPAMERLHPPWKSERYARPVPAASSRRE